MSMKLTFWNLCLLMNALEFSIGSGSYVELDNSFDKIVCLSCHNIICWWEVPSPVFLISFVKQVKSSPQPVYTSLNYQLAMLDTHFSDNQVLKSKIFIIFSSTTYLLIIFPNSWNGSGSYSLSFQFYTSPPHA